MKQPNIFEIDNLKRHINVNSTIIQGDGGAWVPVRPLGYPSLLNRLNAAWLVLTGKADALKWRGQ